MRNLLRKIRLWASEYEPAVAATLAAAVFQMLAGVGIAVGDWPTKVDAVLGFVAVLATLLAGRSIRKRVWTADAVRRERIEAYGRGHNRARDTYSGRAR